MCGKEIVNVALTLGGCCEHSCVSVDAEERLPGSEETLLQEIPL